MTKVAIIGVGQSEFFRSYPGSIRELAFEAYRDAVQDSGIKSAQIDASVVCSAPEYDKQRTPSGLMAEYLGLNPQPTFFVESQCSSSSSGLRTAYALVASGLHKVVMVLGFQKMSEMTSAEAQERMARGSDVQWEAPFGTMMPAYYAMYARGHFERYGTTEEDLALIRLKSSIYGRMNDKAVFRKPLTLDSIMASKYVTTPLKMYDCCANADGSSCVIFASEERARDFCQKPVWIRGLGMATASMSMTGRDTYSGLKCAQLAAKSAYEMAGITAKDVDVAEVHDCFTIAEMMAYEDLGFAEPGQGKDLIRNKETYKEGKIPVNLDGGLLSKGHPAGATGGSQVRSIVLQLRGEAGEIQVPEAKIGLVHNIGGVGIYGNVTIFGKD